MSNQKGGMPEDLRNVLTRQCGSILEMQKALEVCAQYATVIGCPSTVLAPGYAAAFTLLVIDEAELYEIKGGYNKPSMWALTKNSLNRIADAAGWHWDIDRSIREDSGSDSNYARYKAVGYRILLDGQKYYESSTKELDMRNDSALVAEKVEGQLRWNIENLVSNKTMGLAALPENIDAIMQPPVGAREIMEQRRLIRAHNAAVGAHYNRKDRGSPKKLKDPWEQIRDIRSHLLSHAETKAKNRVIRAALGLPTKGGMAMMTRFVVMRAVFTGRFGVPEVDNKVMLMMATQALGAEALLGYVIPQMALARPVDQAVALPAPAARLSIAGPEIVEHSEDEVDPFAALPPDTENDAWGPPDADDDESNRLTIKDLRTAVVLQAKAKGVYETDGGINAEMVGRMNVDGCQGTLKHLRGMPAVEKVSEGFMPPADDPAPF